MSTHIRLVNSNNEPLFAVFGPLHQYLVTPEDVSGAFALVRAIVPHGTVIPLHSHADPEVFFVLEGTLEFVEYDSDSSRWVTASPSDLVCIPGEVRHALRNSSSLPTTVLLVTTPNIYGFFRELEKPFDPDHRQCRQHQRTCSAYWPSPPNTTTGSLRRKRMRRLDERASSGVD